MSLLKLHNIGKIYNSNDVLTIGIRNINLEFDLNEFVVIEGESGSGKSTLLNVIGANDTYEEGEMYFNGEETSHYGISEWGKYREENIATIFQDFNIIENLTVLENVELVDVYANLTIDRTKTKAFYIDSNNNLKEVESSGAGRYVRLNVSDAGTYIVCEPGIPFIMPMWGYIIIICGSLVLVGAISTFIIVRIIKKKRKNKNDDLLSA